MKLRGLTTDVLPQNATSGAERFGIKIALVVVVCKIKFLVF
jgi:hypothetical protein